MGRRMITWFVLLLVGVVAVNGNTVPPTDESSNGNTATTMPSGTTVPSSWNVSADPPSVDATDGQLIDAATMPPLDTNGTNDSGSDEISMPLDTNGTDGNTTTKMPPIDTMDDQSTLMNTINELAADDENGLSYFRDALMACDLLDQLLDNVESEYTIFAPTNAALKANKQFLLYLQGLEDMPQSRWYYNLRTTLLYHMAPNVTLLSADIFDSQRTEIETMLGVESNYTIPVSQFSKKLGGAGLIQSNIQRSNGVLHVIDRVLVPKYLSQSLSMLELQPEYGPDVLERTALVDVVAVMDPTRSTLNQISQTGLTFAGCRIRAFNRLEEYLPQTINYSLNVTHGELLNETYAAQAKSNLLEYSLIAKNYYYDDIPDGYEELVTPLSGSKCNGAQMWITKSEGALCFNSGCTIEMPNVRKYLASNGVGYVIDKCQVCLGVAMLTDVAAEFTKYNMRDTAQFLVASLWNLRDLRQSVGNGQEDITLFASANKGWDVFNLEDTTRLASDEWNPHKLDLLRHFIVQGRYTYGDLNQKYQEAGPYNLTSLAGEPLLVDYNETTKKIRIAGGDIFYEDIYGVDGIVHFTEAVPLPKSVTETVYDYAKSNANFSSQVTLIDAVYLTADMKRLSPITVLYAPNPEWENKKIGLEEISKSVLENMIFKSLLWCDTLRSMKGQYVESHNQKYWAITINDDNMPCFEFTDNSGGDFSKLRSCVTKCDTLARNGIVHEVETLLLFESPETLPPEKSGARLPGMEGDKVTDLLKQSMNQTKTSTGNDGFAGSNEGDDSAFKRTIPTDEKVESSGATAHSCQRNIIVSSIVAMIMVALMAKL